jgi:hypothetical protein
VRPFALQGLRVAVCWQLAALSFLFAGAVLLGGTRPAGAQDEPERTEPALTAEGDFAPAVQLLPDGTQGFLELQDLPALTERWRRTSLADLQHDEAMRDFIESQRELIESKLSELGVQAGISIADLQGAISGEFVVAWMRYEAPERPFAVALFADTRQRAAERAALLKKVDSSLRARGASVSGMNMRGYQATIYKLPQKKGQLGVEQLGVVEVDGRVMLSDRIDTLAGLVSAAIDGRGDGLVQIEEYRQVFEHESLQVEEQEPDGQTIPFARWFARPIELGMILRELAGVDRGNEIDVLQLLSDEGFDVLRSVGGHVYLATQHYDLLHRGFMFAPPTAEGPERYTRAARMLQFPNSQFGELPGWVLPSAASVFQANWKLEEAFWAMQTLVDSAFGGSVFQEMLDGIQAEYGIDLGEEVIGRFGESLIVMTDNTIDGEATQERVVSAIPVREQAEVLRVLTELFKGDPNFEQIDYPHHPVWEVREAEVEDVEFNVEFGGDFGGDDLALQGQQKNKPLLESWGITVFDGHLMFSSHVEALVDLIEHQRSGEGTFADQPAFQRVRDAIAREGGEERAMERVIRTDLAWRIKYGLVREGRFLESDSLLASIINRLLERAERAEPQPGAPPKPKVDFSKLPPFAEVRDYMQPGGGFFQTTAEGWQITQFLLRKPD